MSIKRSKCFIKTTIVIIALSFLLQASCTKDPDHEAFLKKIGGKRLPKVTLSVYLPASPNEYPYNFGYTLTHKVTDEIKKRLLNSLNVEVKFANVKLVFSAGGSYTKITADPLRAIQSKKPCDIYFLNENSFALGGTFRSKTTLATSSNQYLADLYRRGLAKDITSLFPKFASEYYKQFKPEELKTVESEGKLLAIPSRGRPFKNNKCIIARDDLIKKYNIKKISNYEEFESFMKTVRKNEPDITPLALNNTTIDLFANAYGYINVGYGSANGIVYKSDDPSMKLMAWEQTPGFSKAVDTLQRWALEGYFKGYWIKSSDDISSGKYASFIGDTGLAEAYNRQLEYEGERKFKYVEFPLDLGYKPNIYLNPCNLIVINPKSPNADRAIMFVEWLMSSQKNYDLFAYGIQGEDYTLTRDNIIKLKIAEGHDISGAYLECYRNWGITNIYLDNRNSKKITDEIKSIYSNKGSIPHEGFTFDYRSFLNQEGLNLLWKRNTIDAEIIKNNINQMYIDEYIQSQQQVMDNLLTEVQMKLDKWMEEQKAKEK